MFRLLCVPGISALAACLTLGSLTHGTPSHAAQAAGKGAHDAHPPIVVAIVDDGLQYTHPMLKPYIWTNAREISANNYDDDHNGLVDDVHGWDFADFDSEPSPSMQAIDRDHGTYLAGLITQYAEYVFGESAPRRIKLMPVKVLEDASTTNALTTGFEGIKYASQMGAHVILTAWSTPNVSIEESKILSDAARAGAFVIGAAGNLGSETSMYPAAHADVLAVAGHVRDRRLPLSNYGQFVDISAPGDSIISISRGSESVVRSASGTSPASAVVAAVSAVLWAKFPAALPADIRACLMATAKPLGNLDEFEQGRMGAGALNVLGAESCLAGELHQSNSVSTAPKGYIFSNSTGNLQTFDIRPQGLFLEGVLKALSPKSLAPTADLDVFVKQGRRTGRLAGDAPMNLTSDPIQIDVVGSGTGVAEPIAYYEFRPRNLINRFCDQAQIVNTERVINDGSGAGDYAAGSDCKWQIKAPEGHRVVLAFHRLNTELQRDLVYAFAGQETSATIIAIVSGNNLPPIIKSPGEDLLLWFVTDMANHASGFEVAVSFEPQRAP